MSGIAARRNRVIEENSVRVTPSASLIGTTKNDSPYPLIPAVTMLVEKT